MNKFLTQKIYLKKTFYEFSYAETELLEELQELITQTNES